MAEGQRENEKFGMGNWSDFFPIEYFNLCAAYKRGKSFCLWAQL